MRSRERKHSPAGCELSAQWVSLSLPRFPGETGLAAGLLISSLEGGGSAATAPCKEAIEEQAAVLCAAAVEAEGELVAVVVQLGVADCALVGAEEPSLDQRGDEVHMWERDMCGVACGRDVGDDVREAVAGDVVIAGPCVGADFAAARRHQIGAQDPGCVWRPARADRKMRLGLGRWVPAGLGETPRGRLCGRGSQAEGRAVW
jgi:hypothetical protein